MKNKLQNIIAAIKVTRSEIFQNIIGWIVFYYIKFALLTSKVKIHYRNFDLEKYQNTQCILATWHGRVLIMPMINPFLKPSSALVSPHKDGRLIGEVVKHANISLIYGSSNKRRIPSLKEILSFIKKGYNFLITPDGPRGPSCSINGAIINIASSTGLPIFPASCAAKRAFFFRTWDKFMFVLPFNHIEIFFDQPIHVPENIDLIAKNNFAQKLKVSLDEITYLAERNLVTHV